MSDEISDLAAEAQYLTLQMSPATKCLQCVSEHNEAKKKMPDQDPPEINDCVTWAPSWISRQLMGQIVMAVAVVPACMDHLETKEKSAEERAVEGGFLLGGAGG